MVFLAVQPLKLNMHAGSDNVFSDTAMWIACIIGLTCTILAAIQMAAYLADQQAAGKSHTCT